MSILGGKKSVGGAVQLGARGAAPARPAGGPAGPAGGRAPAGDSAIVQVSEREFEREVLTSELPVLIEFSADWCAPCKQIAPQVEAFARENAGKVKVVKVDIDRSPMLARELRVQSVPTFMVFAQQRIVDVQVGAIGKKQMLAMVEPFLPRAEGAIKPLELAEAIRQGMVTAVDTRDKGAYDRAHIPGAAHMPLEEIESRLAELYMLADRPVLYCRAGDKSKELAARLAEQDVAVAFLEGGFLGWESDGLPVERP
ncbi:thioredoxin domain-containing protein [Pendulispora brunnea]|uniref:Thioredoxin domain-containing protein n=1 Tax=Pendulispora brunnea TaxID=2905690 RepID=A0ABZ2KDF5_9BACT